LNKKPTGERTSRPRKITARGKARIKVFVNGEQTMPRGGETKDSSYKYVFVWLAAKLLGNEVQRVHGTSGRGKNEAINVRPRVRKRVAGARTAASNGKRGSEMQYMMFSRKNFSCASEGRRPMDPPSERQKLRTRKK